MGPDQELRGVARVPAHHHRGRDRVPEAPARAGRLAPGRRTAGRGDRGQARRVGGRRQVATGPIAPRGGTASPRTIPPPPPTPRPRTGGCPPPTSSGRPRAGSPPFRASTGRPVSEDYPAGQPRQPDNSPTHTRMVMTSSAVP